MCARIPIERINLVVLFCVILSMPAMAQLGTGTITGTTQDTSGAVIPGVTVTLSNPGVIGGNQEAVTDERGFYQFIRLVPSTTYSVRAELAGFRAAGRNNLVINADVNVRVDLTLEVGQLSDQVTVTGEAPLLDTTAVLNQQVMTREVLDTLPTGNDLWSIGQMIPGVVMQTYDVGGSNSASNQALTSHGSGTNEQKYMIDGMDTSSGNNNGASSVSYYDTYMFEEINYRVGNNSAEMAQGGVIMNMITKTGTNQFRGSYRFVGTNSSLQSNNISPELNAQLQAGVSPRVLAVTPNPRNGITELFETGLSLSGPILRDKLWFTTTGKLNPISQIRIGSYNADGTQVVNTMRMKNVSFKISWQVKPGSQLHLTHNYNAKGELNFLGGSELSPAFGEQRATQIRDQRMKTTQLKWTGAISPKALLDVAASYQYGPFPSKPQPEVQPGDIPRFDIGTQTRTVAATTYTLSIPPRLVFQTSLSYVLGPHDVKFGYQMNNTDWRFESYSTSHYPSGLEARYRNEVPTEVRLYNTPVVGWNYLRENAIYAQDKWRVGRKVTMNLGLRLEKLTGHYPAQCQQETIFIKAQCFPEQKNIPKWLDLAPRFGLIYDLQGDGKTAIKFSANRYWPTVGVAHPGAVNPVATGFETRQWQDRNGDLIPQLDELGPGTGFNLGNTNRYNPNLQRPFSNELNAEFEHQMFGNVVVGVGYFHRQRLRSIGRWNLAVPRESYVPIQVTESVSGRQVTVYNQDAALRGRFDVLLDNAKENDGHYNGVDFTFNKRLSNRWMVMGGVTVAKNIGRQDLNADLNDPNIQFSRGLFETDIPVSFKASALYQLPYGINLSGNVRHFTGVPEDTTVLVTASTVALTQVSQSIRIEPRGTTRYPDVNITDISLRKIVRLGQQRTVEPVMDIFNVFNANPVQLRLTQLGPTYQRPSNVLTGRLVRFALYMTF